MLSPLTLPLIPDQNPLVLCAREWRKLYQIFWVEQKKFYASFDTAIGILLSMLIYPSKARNDIDIAICQRPAEIPQAEWTPDKQFQAAMTKLRTSYAPRNETGTTTLRRQLQELSDEIVEMMKQLPQELRDNFERLWNKQHKRNVKIPATTDRVTRSMTKIGNVKALIAKSTRLKVKDVLKTQHSAKWIEAINIEVNS
jgi:hypothetical protein